MNSKITLFLFGLLCGLIICFFYHKINNSDKEMPSLTGDPNMTGYPCTAASLATEFQAYNDTMVVKFGMSQDSTYPKTSVGGYISKAALLPLVSGTADNNYVHYQFYLTAAGQIGIFFQNQNNLTYGVRNGNAAFCPTLCNYPPPIISDAVKE